ncbi:hypothetical protein K435DRAFT_559431, partial [Dendrothele bispora CBS 962.96]
EIVFRCAEMAPPSRVCSRNYAWYVHFEKLPHPFAVIWMPSRMRGTNDGGYFYNSKSGIRIEAAANTIFI